MEDKFKKHNLKEDYIAQHKEQLLEIISMYDALQQKYPELLLDYKIEQYFDYNPFAENNGFAYIAVRPTFCQDLASWGECGVNVKEIEKRDWKAEVAKWEEKLNWWTNASEEEKQAFRQRCWESHCSRLDCSLD